LVLLGASAVAGPAAAASVHCPKGNRCIPIGQHYRQDVAPAPAPVADTDSHIKPKAGLTHPNGVGW
jgi:hypothetical protein